MKKCLLIGGFGFIGSHLYGILKDFLSVSIYDTDIPTGNPSEEVVALRKKELSKSIYWDDVISTHWNYVIHLGSIAGVRGDVKPDIYFGNNNGDLQRYIRGISYDKFIYISSSSVLGNKASPYSLSKQIAEAQVKEYCPNYVIIRPFTVFGENGRPDMLITRGLTQDVIQVNGNPKDILRYYTYVGDLILCIYQNLNRWNVTINAIGSKLYSVKDILDILQKPYIIKDKDIRDFTEYAIDDAEQFVCTTLVEDFVERIRRKENE